MVMQFNLKTVLLGMTGIAVVCSVIAPFIRHLPIKSVGSVFAGAILGVGFTLILDTFVRRRTKKLLGRRLASLQRTERWFQYCWRRVFWFIASVLAAVTFLAMIVGTAENVPAILALQISGVLAIGVTAQFIDSWRSFVGVQLHEKGLQLNGSRHRWSDLRRTYWNEETGRLILRTGSASIRVVVPLEDRHKVSSIIHRNCMIEALGEIDLSCEAELLSPTRHPDASGIT
jgi:hypothetical protein